MPSKTIDKDIKELVENFLEEKIYSNDLFDKDNLLSVLIYGSTQTGYSSKNSDIDLLIVTISGDNVERGVSNYKNRKIEYFIKPFEKYMDESQKFTASNCPSHLAIEQNTYLLFDRGGFMENVLKTEVDFYNKNRKPPKFNKEIKLVQIENRMASLKNILERNGKEFFMVYYNILELLRVYHSTTHEEADIPFAKAFRIYKDKNYYKKFVSASANNPLPDKRFVELYTKCVEEHGDEHSMFNNLMDLYRYESRGSKIDPKNYKIKL